MPACRLDRQCFESRRKGAVCQNRPINEQQMLMWPQIGASLPLGPTQALDSATFFTKLLYTFVCEKGL